MFSLITLIGVAAAALIFGCLLGVLLNRTLSPQEQKARALESKLQDSEKSHSKPQWNRDGIVLIWDVVDSKAIEHFIRHKGPNHVNDEHNCRQIPRKEPIELNDRYVRLLFLAGHHVDLFEFSFFVFLLQELSLLEWASLATGLILYGQLEIVHVVLMVV